MNTEKPHETFGKLVVDDIPANDPFVGLNKDEVFVHRALGEHETELAKAAMTVFKELRALADHKIKLKSVIGIPGQETIVEGSRDAMADETVLQACSMLEQSLVAAKKIRKASYLLHENPEAI